MVTVINPEPWLYYSSVSVGMASGAVAPQQARIDVRRLVTDGGGHLNDVGRILTLKPGNPAQSWSPGWFMAWRPPENMGGADYKENIISCIDESMFDAGSIVPIDTEQGKRNWDRIFGVGEKTPGRIRDYGAEKCRLFRHLCL